jgi:hypothetical protein
MGTVSHSLDFASNRGQRSKTGVHCADRYHEAGGVKAPELSHGLGTRQARKGRGNWRYLIVGLFILGDIVDVAELVGIGDAGLVAVVVHAVPTRQGAKIDKTGQGELNPIVIGYEPGLNLESDLKSESKTQSSYTTMEEAHRFLTPLLMDQAAVTTDCLDRDH